MTLIIYVKCKDATILALDKKESYTSDAGQGIKKYYMPTNREFVLALAGEGTRIDMIVSELHKNQDIDSSTITKELHRVMKNVKLGDIDSMVSGLLLIRDGNGIKFHDVQCSESRETITEDEPRFKHYGDGSYLVDYLIREFDLPTLSWVHVYQRIVRIIDAVATQVSSVGSMGRYGVDVLVFTDDNVLARTFHNTSKIGRIKCTCDVGNRPGMQPKTPESMSKTPSKESNVIRASTEITTAGDGNYILAYHLTGGKITSVVTLKDSNSLLISLDANGDGELTVTLPRSLIDAMIGSHNGHLLVLCDGNLVHIHETVAAENRTVTIPFKGGCRKIKIIGSELLGRSTNPDPGANVRDAEELSQAGRMRVGPFAIQTDQISYAYGSDMVVTITNPYFAPSEQMSLSVTDDKGNVVYKSMIPVSEDELGIYQKVIRMVGRQWAKLGTTFRISAEYQDKQASVDIDTKQPEMSIELDQKSYSWTDKVYLTVTVPGLLKNPNSTTRLSDVRGCFLEVSTSSGTLHEYDLMETEAGLGIFTGEVRLTGFSGHDIHGDGRRDLVGGETGGNGPIDGMIGCFRKDTLTVTLVTHAGRVNSSAAIQWNLGEIHWLEKTHLPSGAGTLLVADPDMSLNPEETNKVKVRVWSDSDPVGIWLWLRETGRTTGIFSGIVHFTKKPSSIQDLKVSEGDRITAEYIDRTLPEPYQDDDALPISCDSFIRDQIPHTKRVLAENTQANKSPSTPIISIPSGTSVPGCEENNSCFMPYKIAVRVNQTVIWTNDDNVAHNIISGTIDDGHDGIFGSGLILPESSFGHKFVRKGKYNYYCVVHPWQSGIVVVE